MILNAYTIVMLFIAILTGILAVPLGFFSFSIYKKWGSQLYDEEKNAIVNRAYLLLLMAVVILFIKLLSWPFFYATLKATFRAYTAQCAYSELQEFSLT